jgi:hypothetical protein
MGKRKEKVSKGHTQDPTRREIELGSELVATGHTLVIRSRCDSKTSLETLWDSKVSTIREQLTYVLRGQARSSTKKNTVAKKTAQSLACILQEKAPGQGNGRWAKA